MLMWHANGPGKYLRQSEEGEEERRHSCAQLGLGCDDAAAACERVAAAAEQYVVEQFFFCALAHMSCERADRAQWPGLF